MNFQQRCFFQSACQITFAKDLVIKKIYQYCNFSFVGNAPDI